MHKLIAAILILSCCVTACRKKSAAPVSATPAASTIPVNNGDNVNVSPQVSYRLDSVLKFYTQDEANISTTQGGSSNPGFNNFVFSSGMDSSNVNAITITKGTLVTNSGNPSTTAFKSFFPLGAHAYSVKAVQGVEISIKDLNGVLWSTSRGSADQTGSSFAITGSKDNGDNLGYRIKIKATFNCKLYDDNGHVKTLTNGIYFGDFSNI